ncbi:MAG: hypothetical protein COX79_04595 [Candidatus Levybacteria bacterium CG_4_10_14_0_2_um_filter_36_16]|nr:MAG: hypothetical protein AUK12_03010 [Candidatus Levybacteria bacterium CG2_30_37_29]PIR79627.1 MAG: hypothetical protein COU26_00135 [Candidatus Levybacteria bacterium CG10_big_fil_rev_8_21_14_0_10_36_30]PIZ96713.1 MAG: hypothetical protein COX79_04595 [Candidatus Levybacteria bacterium CG_4_10_14_0_2_um_filter_36_16]
MSELGEGPSTNNTTIETVRAIPESRNQIITKREEIPTLVELPLVEACENLYDRNIQTLSSSANSNDINPENPDNSFANIIIDYNSLSGENKKIVEILIKDGKADMIGNYDNRAVVRLRFPLARGTQVKELQEVSVWISEQFRKQPMTWAPTMNVDDVAKMYMSEEVKDVDPQKLAEEIGYYYSPEEKLFYLSEEHYKKVKDGLVTG